MQMLTGRIRSDSTDWDDTSEVVVIGTGVAGSAAALAARDAGADVLVLEKAAESEAGGDSAICGGLFRIERPDEYYTTLMQHSNGHATEELADVVAENARQSIQWIDDKGIHLDWDDDGVLARAPEEGPGMTSDLSDGLNRAGVDVRYECTVKRLLVDDRDAVAGVEAFADGSVARIRATNGVIVATGGFLANEEMVTKYQGFEATRGEMRGRSYATGDGHRMAKDVDANLVDMGARHGGPVQPESQAHMIGWFPFGIVVNENCERFLDESTANVVELGKRILEQPNERGYFVIDESWKENVSEWSQQFFLERDGELLSAPSLTELGDQFGIDGERLKRVVESYNTAVESGEIGESDPPKTEKTHQLNDPPYYGTVLVNGPSLTYGGIDITENAEVVTVQGETVPRLYAAGQVVGGLYYDTYPPGSSLTDGVTFGRIAGENAATPDETLQ